MVQTSLAMNKAYAHASFSGKQVWFLVAQPVLDPWNQVVPQCMAIGDLTFHCKAPLPHRKVPVGHANP